MHKMMWLGELCEGFPQSAVMHDWQLEQQDYPHTYNPPTQENDQGAFIDPWGTLIWRLNHVSVPIFSFSFFPPFLVYVLDCLTSLSQISFLHKAFGSDKEMIMSYRTVNVLYTVDY